MQTRALAIAISIAMTIAVSTFGATPVGAAPAVAQAPVRAPNPSNAKLESSPAQWSYRTTRDEMRNMVMQFAALPSLNKVHGESVQQPPTTLRVLLRKRGQSEPDVLLVTEGWDLPCRPECEFAARFDDGDVEDWPALPAERGRSDIVAVHHSEAFLRLLRGSRKLVVEIGMAGLGSAQFTFDPRGLKWD